MTFIDDFWQPLRCYRLFHLRRRLSLRRDTHDLFRLTLSFGHQRADGLPVTEEHISDARRYIQVWLADRCGGGRVTTDLGFYRFSDGSLCMETSTSICSYGTGVLPDATELDHLASAVGCYLGQAEVLDVVELLNGWLRFVGPQSATEADLRQVAVPQAVAQNAG